MTMTPKYCHSFPADQEAAVAAKIDAVAAEIFSSMMGDCLDDALQAMQAVLTRYRKGDPAVTTSDALRAAREMRAASHERASLMRMCRAQAIERLGLRPRPPVTGEPARKAEPQAAAEEIVKTHEPARGPLGDWLKVDVRQTEIPTDTATARS